jgi:hypothetical protein
MTMTLVVLGITALYALVRGFMDLRQRRYVWGAAGLLCAIACGTLFLLTPIPTHAVKVDLPQASG